MHALPRLLLLYHVRAYSARPEVVSNSNTYIILIAKSQIVIALELQMVNALESQMVNALELQMVKAYSPCGQHSPSNSSFTLPM